MSIYQQMWTHVKTLSQDETIKWIAKLEPPRGVGVDFYGVRVLDVDLLEALRFWAFESRGQ